MCHWVIDLPIESILIYGKSHDFYNTSTIVTQKGEIRQCNLTRICVAHFEWKVFFMPHKYGKLQWYETY